MCGGFNAQRPTCPGPPCNRLFFNPLPSTESSDVFLNAGPLVHLAHERTSYENSIDGVGKAIIIEDDVIVSIKESDEVIDEYSLHRDDVGRHR